MAWGLWEPSAMGGGVVMMRDWLAADGASLMGVLGELLDTGGGLSTTGGGFVMTRGWLAAGGASLMGVLGELSATGGFFMARVWLAAEGASLTGVLGRLSTTGGFFMPRVWLADGRASLMVSLVVLSVAAEGDIVIGGWLSAGDAFSIGPFVVLSTVIVVNTMTDGWLSTFGASLMMGVTKISSFSGTYTEEPIVMSDDPSETVEGSVEEAASTETLDSPDWLAFELSTLEEPTTGDAALVAEVVSSEALGTPELEQTASGDEPLGSTALGRSVILLDPGAFSFSKTSPSSSLTEGEDIGDWSNGLQRPLSTSSGSGVEVFST